MITDADIKKLKAVFATKDDLLAMEKRADAKYATKTDLVAMEKRADAKYATKDDLKKMGEDIVKAITDLLAHNLFPILELHEKRLDRLEKHVSGFPPIA